MIKTSEYANEIIQLKETYLTLNTTKEIEQKRCRKDIFQKIS